MKSMARKFMQLKLDGGVQDEQTEVQVGGGGRVQQQVKAVQQVGGVHGLRLGGVGGKVVHFSSPKRKRGTGAQSFTELSITGGSNKKKRRVTTEKVVRLALSNKA